MFPEPFDQRDAVEQAILDVVMRGRVQRFEAVVRAHEADVRRWLHPRAAWAASLDDLVQRTFVEAYRCLERYEAGSDVRRWLCGIARNVLREELRTREREARRHTGYGQLRPLLESFAGDDPHADERLDALRQCRDALAPADQDLLRLRYDQGLSTVEIGVQLGRSAGAIKTRLYELRRQLREAIAARLKEER